MEKRNVVANCGKEGRRARALLRQGVYDSHVANCEYCQSRIQRSLDENVRTTYPEADTAEEAIGAVRNRTSVRVTFRW